MLSPYIWNNGSPGGVVVRTLTSKGACCRLESISGWIVFHGAQPDSGSAQPQWVLGLISHITLH